MEIALTHHTVGYYTRADRLLGHGGDFSTAPAMSPFFTRTLARLVTELVDASMEAEIASAQNACAEPNVPPGSVALPGADACPQTTTSLVSVVELGGGEGHLAEGILRYWHAERPDLRAKVAYRLVEVGERLRLRQRAAVEGMVAAGWDVEWGSNLMQACSGTRPVVVVSNEFLDAMPAHVIEVGGDSLREAYVTVAAEGLEQVWGEVSDPAAAEMGLLFGTLDPRRLEAVTADGILEVVPGLGDLTRQVGAVVPSGSFVSIDYGEWFEGVTEPGGGGDVVRPRGEDSLCQAGGPCLGEQRRGPEGRVRHRRSVRGYFKHQLVLDPLARAGRQDLTADVDFAALDLHGRREGFETVVFTTLAGFLRGGGAEDELRALRASIAGIGTDVLEADRQATVLENLLDESDLGSAFKVMVQVKD
jgi:SAM-dependent MidA family methyltransferase